MRSGIKTWCDLHKRNADSLIKPSCGCRLCEKLPKNHPINLSTILQECGEEGGEEEEEGCEGAGECSPAYPRSTLHAEGPAFPAHKPRMEKIMWRWGLGSQGTCRGWGEKQTKCFNSCPFSFLHLFCPRIWFPSERVDFLGAKGSAQQGLFTLRGRLFPSLYKVFAFEEKKGVVRREWKFYRVHAQAKPVEKMQSIWILSRDWQQMKKRRIISHSSSWLFGREIVLQERRNAIPMQLPLSFQLRADAGGMFLEKD